MPGRDGTGPSGQGPLTGRGLGPCGRGLGFRRGFGRGFGWRRFSDEPVYEPLTLTKEEQKKILEEEKKDLELELQRIQERLKELK